MGILSIHEQQTLNENRGWKKNKEIKCQSSSMNGQWLGQEGRVGKSKSKSVVRGVR